MAKSYVEKMLSDREKLVLICQQHWFLLASMVSLEIFYIIAIGIATLLGALYAENYSSLIYIVGAVGLVFPIASIIRDILIWRNHQYIITNRRVMQVAGIINKNVVDSSLEKVNDVKMNQSFFGRIFNFGDIEILTASELGVNKFKRISNPIRFKTVMLNMKEQLERGGVETAEREDVPRLIGELDALRKRGLLTDTEFEEKKARLLAKI